MYVGYVQSIWTDLKIAVISFPEFPNPLAKLLPEFIGSEYLDVFALRENRLLKLEIGHKIVLHNPPAFVFVGDALTAM